MKKNLHPDYHEITLILTDGEKRKVFSTYGKPGDTVQLDIDNKSHHAWTGQQRTFEKGGKIDRFKDRYGDLGSL
ncbi:MAG: 50S ribosomal protein L31 [Holosporaceae bacterium]